MRRTRARLAAAVLAAAVGAFAAPAADAAVSVSDTSIAASDARAGAHPDVTIQSSFGSLGSTVLGDDVRDVSLSLPPGLIGNPRAVPRCSTADFQADRCNAGTQVGSITANATGKFFFEITQDVQGTVYNLTPNSDQIALLGVWLRPVFAFFPLEKFSFLAPVKLRASTDFGLDAALSSLPRDVNFIPLRLNRVRFTLAGMVSGTPFMTNPTSCLPATATVRAISYGGATASQSASYTPTECSTLPFSAGFSLSGGSGRTETPTGADITLTTPESELPRRNAHIRKAVVELPDGVGVNAGLANGLAGCDETAFRGGAACPAASDIGDVLLSSPPIGDVPGDVYFATPTAAKPWRFLVEARLPGQRARLFGDLAIEQATGKLTATFAELPQVPIGRLVLHLNGGSRGAFLTPTTCGTKTARATLEPWTRATGVTPPNAVATSSFEASYDGSGAPCPATLPFAPALDASATPLTAGGSPALSLRLERPDRNQRLRRATVHLPPGLAGKLALAGLERCTLTNAAAGHCQEASRVGTATVVAGAGDSPVTLSGQVFLTTGEPGDLAGLSIKIPGRVGPVDLGDVIVPARLVLRASDKGLDVITGELPQSKAGVPVPVRALDLLIDRVGFLTAPTACDAKTVRADITGTGGTTVQASDTLQFTGCSSLAFNPSLTATITTAGTPAANQPAALRATVGVPTGNANMRDVTMTLPRALGPNLLALGRACPPVNYEAGTCSADARIGTARAVTPLLGAPLEGPVVLLQNPGSALLPHVAIELDGPISLVLRGRTNLTPEFRLQTIIEGAPDLPLGSFELTIDGDANGLLRLIENPCAARAGLTGAADLTAHSGATRALAVPFEVTGCSGTTDPDPTTEPGSPPTTVKPPAAAPSGDAGGDTAAGGKPTAKLVLRFASGRGVLTGAVRAAQGAPLLRRVRVTLPKGLTRKGKRGVTVAARGAGSAKIPIKLRALKPSRALRRRLRRRARVLTVGLMVTSAGGSIAALRLRVPARL